MAEFLLRFCENAPVLLYRSRDGAYAQNVPTRVDLFSYVGGYAWGYGGTGPQSLSHAIAGKLFELAPLSDDELRRRARIILDNVIMGLDRDATHDVARSRLMALFPGEVDEEAE